MDGACKIDGRKKRFCLQGDDCGRAAFYLIDKLRTQLQRRKGVFDKLLGMHDLSKKRLHMKRKQSSEAVKKQLFSIE